MISFDQNGLKKLEAKRKNELMRKEQNKNEHTAYQNEVNFFYCLFFHKLIKYW